MNGDLRPTLTAAEEAAIIDYAEWSGIDPGELDTLVLPSGDIYVGRVKRDAYGRRITEPTTCGACGFQWDDALCTSITPVPSGRCPNEYGHPGPEDDPDDTLIIGAIMALRAGNDADALSHLSRYWDQAGEPDSHAAEMIGHVIDAGPAPGEDFYRLKITGDGSTPYLNVSPAQLAAIREVLR